MLLLARSRKAVYRPHVYITVRALVTPRKRLLPKIAARTRFAPSPTGYLHLGSLRTALYNYLLAKSTGGQFILRIEDTDKARTVAGAEQRLYEDLKWAGLEWDEGPDVGGPYGPYKQSERIHVYEKHAQQLIDSDLAYRCFCSKPRLASIAGQKGSYDRYYDRKCWKAKPHVSARRALAGEPYIVRLKMPKAVGPVQDLVYGNVGLEMPKKEIPGGKSRLYRDPVLVKSDGMPTYHFANVVDDHYMDITHVIRGTEWLTSTPTHRLLYRYLGWDPPLFAHVGLLQNNKREKLSKRDDVLGFRSFETDGIFPEALVNFVALFGWSHKLPSDIFTMQDLIKNFSLKFTKGDAIIEPAKLFFLQKKHAQRYIESGGEEFGSMVLRVAAVAEEYSKLNQVSLLVEGEDLRKRVNALLRIDSQSYTTPRDFFDRHSYCFRSVSRPPYVPRAGVTSSSLKRDDMQMISDRLGQIPADDWSIDIIKRTTGELACAIGGLEPRDLGADDVRNEAKAVEKSIIHYLRWALTGGQPGPGIQIVMIVLGQDVTMQRLREANAEFETFSSTDEACQIGIAAAAAAAAAAA